MITRHAAQRAYERAGITDPADVYALWERGRRASDEDLATFRTRAAWDVEYRIAIYRGQAWLLARGCTTGALITILPRSTKGKLTGNCPHR